MLPRVSLPEVGKDSLPRSQSRVFPSYLLKFFLLFLALGLGISLLSIYMTRYFGAQNAVSAVPPTFQGCFEEPNSLDHWIKPPSKLMHQMNDTELFWRASFVPRVKKYPFRRVPKIALMFLARGPLPLYPLWEEFLKGHEGLFSIYVHSLPSYRGKFQQSSAFYRREIPSQVSEWGEMSMCDAERRLLANSLLDISNEWFVLLSESCIPLFNFNVIYSYLLRSQYSFLGSFDDPGPYGRGRYNKNMAPEVNISDWRKGSQWFAINRRLAVNIVEDTKYYHKFKEFCKPPCYVDEHYFPTMLSIEQPQLMGNRTITWVDWSRGGAHPATFGSADITEEFLKRILEGQKCSYNNRPSSNCFLFARKFAPSALVPLLNLAPKFLGFETKQQKT